MHVALSKAEPDIFLSCYYHKILTILAGLLLPWFFDGTQIKSLIVISLTCLKMWPGKGGAFELWVMSETSEQGQTGVFSDTDQLHPFSIQTHITKFTQLE